MKIVSDLHAHSKYSRAVSPQMVLPEIASWAKRKGIDIVATGDWTHPLWLKELEAELEEVNDGVYRLMRNKTTPTPLFLLSTEVAAIYSQGGKQRRIHLLLFAPNFVAVEKINKKLASLGANLFSDGRPILGMSAREVTQLVFEADERCLVIPAHAWTPWFSLYGSMSGFDSVEECFGDLAKFIYGIETGLSSDPAMNWRIRDLDNRAILSFSDAHSPAKLVREATAFELPEISYENIYQAIRLSGHSALGKEEVPNGPRAKEPSSPPRIAYTIEFYPEEGKYHYTGHRNCGVKHSPEETKRLGTICPACKRQLTVGVMHRVQELAAREISKPERPSSAYFPASPAVSAARQAGRYFPIQKEQAPLISNDNYGVKWIKHPQQNRPPYIMLVPLLEILAETLGSLSSSQKTIYEYKKLTDQFENELSVLLQTKSEDIERVSGPKIRQALEKVRSGNIIVEPGFDGEYGKVKIWKDEADETVDQKQMGLF